MQGAEERVAEHAGDRFEICPQVSSAATKVTQQMGVFQREIKGDLICRE